ncbi:MAG: ferredoxin [Candidatus Pacearchaeota archaeon]|nr:ferredoxin [Candidatus Pacearchaeota archaeon]
MVKYKISIDENKCIGCGACAAVSKNFEILDGKSRVKKSQITDKDFKLNNEAANLCPVRAIKIEKI